LEIRLVKLHLLAGWAAELWRVLALVAIERAEMGCPVVRMNSRCEVMEMLALFRLPKSVDLSEGNLDLVSMFCRHDTKEVHVPK
jgi:hypothetical protein